MLITRLSVSRSQLKIVQLLTDPLVAPADAVENEPLGPQFAGILGLSLPLNSIIAANLPPKINNEPDGAVLASNLFSITPTSNAPLQRFFSISLSRPDSSLPKALLGIGRHPPEYLTDPRVMRYLPLISERRGTHFWKVNVQSINVFVDGEDRAVEIGNSVNGGVFPSAVLDSGVPVILTTAAIANGIYGAIGIGPANDGQCEPFSRFEQRSHRTYYWVSRLHALHHAAQCLIYIR